MKSLSHLITLCLVLIHLNSKGQTDILRDQRVDPLLRQAAAGHSGLTILPRPGGNAMYVNMAVLDAAAKQLTWFTCYGKVFDSARLSDNEYRELQLKTLDPFAFYRAFCYEHLSYVEKASLLYRLNGKAALQDTNYNYRAVFNTEAVKSASSSLQKLIAIESLMKRTCLQLQLLDMRSPQHLPRRDSFNIATKVAGSMTQRADSTEYFNAYPFAPAARIVLRRKMPQRLFVFDHKGALLDSVPLKQEKYAALLKGKEDVFLLYRGWLELQWQQASAHKLQIMGELARKDTSLYKQAVWQEDGNLLESATAAQQLQRLINDKINRLIVADEQYLAQIMERQYHDAPSELSYLPGLGFACSTAYARGNKRYELTEHRKNVMATVSDRKTGMDTDGDGVIEYYNADIVSAGDYYPFGMMMPGRQYANSAYRYGFNGKENDNEIKGTGNQQDYGMRIYDPRIGRFLSVDPLTHGFPMLTPYQFSSNSPVANIDLDGEEAENAYWGMVRMIKGVEALPMNNLNSLVGQVQQQSYTVHIYNPKHTVDDLYKKVAKDINSIYGTDQGSFEFDIQQRAEEITKGDYVEINPGLKGLNIAVKVTDVTTFDHFKNSGNVPVDGFSMTFRTLEGHVEVGAIQFTAIQTTNPETGVKSFQFDIASTSQIDVGVATAFLSNYARNAQQSVWNIVINKVAEFMDGEVTSANQRIDKYNPSQFNVLENNETSLGYPRHDANPQETEVKDIKIDKKK